MKRKVLSVIVSLCMILTLVSISTENVEALSAPTITSVYQTDIEKCCVRVEFTSSNTGSGFSYSLEDVNSGRTWSLAGSAKYYYIQNLTAGQTLRLRLRAYDGSSYSSYSSVWSITVESGYGNNNYGYQEQNSSQSSIYWNKIEKNDWFYDYTVDGDAVYYQFTTSGRADSKYRFSCRGIGEESVDMYLLNYGASPSDEDAWKIVAYGNNDSSCCSTKTLTLKPNSTYRLRVFYVRYGWGDVVSSSEGGVPYRINVSEIITKPAKGKITSLKAGKKKATVKFSKLSKATRYQIAYKVKGGSFKYVYTKATSKALKSLKSKKTYYVKVRGQRLANGTYYSGPWSTTRSVKVK